MKVTFWGVRGSVPTPRSDMLRYGGNTTCLQVEINGKNFIIDTGTGVIALGNKMIEEKRKDFTLLFTHLHHDHTQGFPFFTPAFSPEFSFNVYSGNFFSKTAQQVLAGTMEDPFFPVPLKDLASNMEFREIDFDDSLVVFDLCDGYVDAIRLKHPRDGVVGYRFKVGKKKIVFLTDCEHYPGRDHLLLPFIQDCDLFIHDTMYTDEEYYSKTMSKIGWGHSTIETAIKLAKKANAKQLVCTHHEPTHSDNFLDKVFREAQKTFPALIGAYEGLVIEV